MTHHTNKCTPSTEPADRASNHRRAGAFTLIELIVVVSIIALLISLLLPALTNARVAARDMQCRSNHRQFAIAYLSYVTDARDRTIRLTTTWEQLYTTLGTYHPGVWRDPALSMIGSPANDKRWWQYGYPGLSGVFNRGVYCITRRAAPMDVVPVRMGELPSPGTVALFTCKAPVGSPGNNNNMGWTGFVGPLAINLDGQVYSPWAAHGPKRPNNGIYLLGTMTNVSRLDGSVRQYAWREIVAFAAWSSNTYSDVPPYPGQSSGQRVPRAYLWNGYAPGRPGSSPTASGWILE